MFVTPNNQHRGIGRLIVNELERKASLEKFNTINITASLVSRQFWESMGFIVEKEDFLPVSNNQKLYYYKMLKTIGDNN